MSLDTPSESPAAWSRRLLVAWALLVALTVASLVAVLGFGTVEAGMAAAAAALTASFFKARLVLDHFLDLRRAGGQWRGFFTGLLLALLGGLMLAYVAAALLN